MKRSTENPERNECQYIQHVVSSQHQNGRDHSKGFQRKTIRSWARKSDQCLLPRREHRIRECQGAQLVMCGKRYAAAA